MSIVLLSLNFSGSVEPFGFLPTKTSFIWTPLLAGEPSGYRILKSRHMATCQRMSHDVSSNLFEMKCLFLYDCCSAVHFWFFWGQSAALFFTYHDPVTLTQQDVV